MYASYLLSNGLKKLKNIIKHNNKKPYEIFAELRKSDVVFFYLKFCLALFILVNTYLFVEDVFVDYSTLFSCVVVVNSLHVVFVCCCCFAKNTGFVHVCGDMYE